MKLNSDNLITYKYVRMKEMNNYIKLDMRLKESVKLTFINCFHCCF